MCIGAVMEKSLRGVDLQKIIFLRFLTTYWISIYFSKCSVLHISVENETDTPARFIKERFDADSAASSRPTA